MHGSKVRQAFLDYFKSKGHTVVPSSSLVPEQDPTLLFANAGMNQFKDLFLGNEKRDYLRAATCQKCMRISGKHNDLENVGVTARHHTFFEMLGNFSFGDYFKADAIKFGWEFVTEVLGLDKSLLWATVYEKDDEAAKLWSELTDIPPERILRMGESSNFWMMGDTGPCGPCSEIFYYVGSNPKNQREAEFRKDDGTYLEIWNLVFMQFDRAKNGKLTPLPKPSVDTGMGLERITAVLQGKKATYDTDLLRYVITRCEELSGFRYDGSSYLERDLRTDKAYARDVAMRVIADHSRAITFLLGDGVAPGSDGRGYVLRRLIRRAVRHGRALEFKEPFLKLTVDTVISAMKNQYPELSERRELILRMADAEERKFHETLDSGLVILQREVEKLKSGELFPGEIAFQLHDTYGFPLDLTEDALKAFSLTVDRQSFDSEMETQRHRSREERRTKNLEFVSTNVEGKATDFLGYAALESESNVIMLFPDDQEKNSYGKGDKISLIFDSTPFYAESGGQVGDTGTVKLDGCLLRVLDAQKVRGSYIMHECEVIEGEIAHRAAGLSARLSVDADRRRRIRANHSATHLVHAALRSVIGNHVKQAGSRVDDRTLRFDYSHFEQVSESQLRDIQSIVNTQVRENHEVVTRTLPIEEAKKTGAIALFGEKYGDMVRVVQIGPKSIEFCGGTHVTRSGDIGAVLLRSDGGISAGVRRIECWAGEGALEQILLERDERSKIAGLLKGDSAQLAEKIEKMLSRTKQLERELEIARARLASASSNDLINTARTTASGIKVIVEKVDGADSDTLRSMVDRLRLKLGSGVVALASASGGSGIVVAGVTADLTSRVNAGALVKEAAKHAGGKGGGRADFAQAGGVDAALLGQTLERLFGLIS